jgi:hypothetical protein
VAGVTWAERQRWLIYPALVSLGVGVLVACAEQPRPPPPQTVAIPPPPPPPPRPFPRRRVFPVPEHKPTPPPSNDASGSDAADEAVAMAGPESAMRTPEVVALPAGPRRLIGLDQPATVHLFGTAAEQSEAPPATVWRYRNASCELDLFFYLDLRSGKMRTLHYAFKGDAADPAQQQACLRSLAAARRS